MVGRLQVGAFHQAQVGLQRRADSRQIGLGPVEIGLQDRADILMAIGAQAAVDAERVVDPARFFHVDADEVAVAGGMDERVSVTLR